MTAGVFIHSCRWARILCVDINTFWNKCINAFCDTLHTLHLTLFSWWCLNTTRVLLSVWLCCWMFCAVGFLWCAALLLCLPKSDWREAALLLIMTWGGKKKEAPFSPTKQNVNHGQSFAILISVRLMDDGGRRSEKTNELISCSCLNNKDLHYYKKHKYATIFPLTNAIVIVVLIICCESPSALLTCRRSRRSKANT